MASQAETMDRKATITLHPTMVVLSLSWVIGPPHKMEVERTIESPLGFVYNILNCTILLLMEWVLFLEKKMVYS